MMTSALKPLVADLITFLKPQYLFEQVDISNGQLFVNSCRSYKDRVAMTGIIALFTVRKMRIVYKAVLI